MFSSSSRSSRVSTSAPQSKPALRHDKRNKRRLLTPQVLVILLCVLFGGCSLVVLVLTRLHHSDDNNNNNNNNKNNDLNKVLKEIVSSNQKPEQNDQQAAANAIPHNRNSSSSSSSSGSSTMTSSSPLTASVVLQRSLPPSVKVHLLSRTRPLKSCPHTIVTAYFQLRSKYTADKYIQWMTNMLSIQDCVVIITSGGANLVETMKRLRQHALDATVILELPNGVNDLPISQLHQQLQQQPQPHADEHAAANPNTKIPKKATIISPEFWPHQLDMDREKKRHKSHQLFWVWLSKTWCVVQAIQQDYFHSNFYMWQDIGAFRDTNVSACVCMCVCVCVFDFPTTTNNARVLTVCVCVCVFFCHCFVVPRKLT
jgi:hypothetical protein